MYCMDFRKPTPLHLGKLYTDIAEGGLSTGQLLYFPTSPAGHHEGYLSFTGSLVKHTPDSQPPYCGFDVYLGKLYRDGSLFDGIEIGVRLTDTGLGAATGATTGAATSANHSTTQYHVVLKDYLDTDVDDVVERFMAPIVLSLDYQSFRIPWSAFKLPSGISVDRDNVLAIGIHAASMADRSSFGVAINYIKWVNLDDSNPDTAFDRSYLFA